MENKKTFETRMDAISPLISEIVSTGGSAEITVTGNSMWPMLLHKVSKVRVARVHELKVGDIPLYKRDSGEYILHRIVGMDDAGYICSGDHQWQLERGIREDQIICVVTHFQRQKKWTSCESRLYKSYIRIWGLLRPARHVKDALVRRIKRLLSRTGYPD